MADRKTGRNDARNEDPGAGEQTGEGVGGIGGTLAGAGLGSIAGPVGTVLGGIAGAVGGWWAGEKAGRALEDAGTHDDHYRRDFESQSRSGIEYDDARIGYGIGHVAGANPSYRGRSFNDVETDIQRGWKHERYGYQDMRPYVQRGFERSSTIKRTD